MEPNESGETVFAVHSNENPDRHKKMESLSPRQSLHCYQINDM